MILKMSIQKLSMSRKISKNCNIFIAKLNQIPWDLAQLLNIANPFQKA